MTPESELGQSDTQPKTPELKNKRVEELQTRLLAGAFQVGPGDREAFADAEEIISETNFWAGTLRQ